MLNLLRIDIKNRHYKLMSLRTGDDKLLENIKPFGVKLKTCKILN